MYIEFSNFRAGKQKCRFRCGDLNLPSITFSLRVFLIWEKWFRNNSYLYYKSLNQSWNTTGLFFNLKEFRWWISVLIDFHGRGFRFRLQRTADTSNDYRSRSRFCKLEQFVLFKVWISDLCTEWWTTDIWSAKLDNSVARDQRVIFWVLSPDQGVYG